ncbi:MAG: hypothetical protein ISS59_08965 [Desulfobacteraceae bacterium]|nr:hypothetical protein [Desulfobacteraceae bacterium]
MGRTLYHYLMGKFVLKMHRKLFATKITKIRKSERLDVYLAAVIKFFKVVGSIKPIFQAKLCCGKLGPAINSQPPTGSGYPCPVLTILDIMVPHFWLPPYPMAMRCAIFRFSWGISSRRRSSLPMFMHQ